MAAVKTVKIQGGLGNQLFCIAFAHSLAVLSGGRAAIDVASYASDRYGHGFELADLAAQLGCLERVARPVLGHRLFGPLLRMLPGTSFVAEDEPPRDAQGLEALAVRGSYFSGYWQDEAYIARPDEIRERVRAFVHQRSAIGDGHDVVMHCRTYKEEIRPERRGVPGEAYFQRALDVLQSRGCAMNDVVMISDDPALAMQRLGALAPAVRIADSGGPYADMALMMGARGLILSNSSFSWWGGFCGAAETVAYPKAAGLFHYPIPARRFVTV